jgi:hypothetical protein
LSQLTSYMVEEGFELAEANSVVVESLVFDHVLCQVDATNVVRCHEDYTFGLAAFDCHLKTVVVAGVGVSN